MFFLRKFKKSFMASMLLSLMLVQGALFNAQAQKYDTLDSENYPYLYLRGTNLGNWVADPNYKFTRVDNYYSITLPELDGEFKIGGDNWQYNLGAPLDGDAQIPKGVASITGYPSGPNFVADNLTNVKIEFYFSKNGDAAASTTVYVTSDAEQLSTAKPSGTLPILHIDIYKTDADGAFLTDLNGNKIYDNDVINKDLSDKDYRKGYYWLDVNSCQWMIDEGAASVGSEEAPLPLEMKARGNYTRTGFAKKPFKLKLGAKQKLLGMGSKASKHWAILAHADDNKGYLRNFTGFNLGKRIGLPWTPSQQPVEVIINGDYRGLYFLTESIRVGDGRVPVTELDDNVVEPTLISGGYLVELDNYEEENQIRLEELGQAPGYKDVLRITYDTPESYSDLQYRFVYDQFNAMNNLIGQNSDELWQYIDIDDLARYYLVEEIISHTESFHGSTYMFRDFGNGQKWHFSPLWDCGNAFNGSSTMFFYDNAPFGNTWIPSIRLNDTFNAKVRDTWMWFMSNCYDGIIDDIDTYVSHITSAAAADRVRWADAPLPSSVNATPVVDNTDMASRRNEVVNHLNTKTNWLKQYFGNYSLTTTPEPARDTTEAAPLPDYAKPASIYGDVDGDGIVNMTDVGILLNIIMGLIE